MVENVVFLKWLENQLSFLLGFPPSEDLAKYILAFESAQEIREHFSNLLDLEDPKSKSFLDEFFKRWTAASVEKGYKKKEIDSPILKTRKPQGNPDKERIGNGTRDSEKTPTKMSVDTKGAEFLDKNNVGSQEVTKKGIPFKKKNLKYIPLYSGDGKLKTDTALLPGRNACQCLAQKHKLINNCIECGRIVCEQEGSGPCMFCGHLVCSPEEQEIISRESKKSKKLMEKLLSQTTVNDVEATHENDGGLQKAIAHKDKLLEFDKNCTKRTKVIDDEADYFAADNRWMTKQQKEALKKRDEELREKRFASRRNKKFTIDFAGRKIMDGEEEKYIYEEKTSNTTNNGTENVVPLLEGFQERYPLIDPRITIEPPKFSSGDSFKGNVTQFLKTQQDAVKNSLRLQDKGLQEMVDQGMCLSMHQPWASLLVHGIKKLEGRSWYSAHRGRLWIASTAKPPDEGLVKEIEKEYRGYYPNERLNFPKDYPSAALLGCVNVIDCASNEEYFQQHPDSQEESNSAYLFVCENAHQLKIKFSMKGKHKIYKLESHMHVAAKKNLNPS